MMNDYQNRLLDIIPVTLNPGEQRAIPGEYNYLGIVSTTAGYENEGALSITGAEFRRIPRGIYHVLPEPTRNVFIRNLGVGVATFDVAVGLGDIRDSRFTLNGASVPVAPAPGACFPIELCPGLAALPVSGSVESVALDGTQPSPLGVCASLGGFIGASTDVVIMAAQAFPVVVANGFLGFGDGNGVGFGAEAEANFYAINGSGQTITILHSSIATAGGKFEFRNAWQNGSVKIPAGFALRVYYSKYSGIGGFTLRYNITVKG